MSLRIFMVDEQDVKHVKYIICFSMSDMSEETDLVHLTLQLISTFLFLGGWYPPVKKKKKKNIYQYVALATKMSAHRYKWMRCKNYQTDICSLSGCQIHPIATNMQQWDATHPSPLPITILLRPYTPFHSVLSDLKAHLPSPPTYPPQMIPFSSKKLLDALKFNNNRKKKKKNVGV